MAERAVETFFWSDAPSALGPLVAAGAFAFDGKRRAFLGADPASGAALAVYPPVAVPLPKALAQTLPQPGSQETAQEFARRKRARESHQKDSGCDLAAYLGGLPPKLPLQCVVLCQAGATAIAMLLEGEPLSTKSFKRYVTRGNGKAQPTYLAQKGKSRYGARLRLQNARRMLEETNERLTALYGEFGEPEQLLVSAPKRLWADLFLAPSRPPFQRDAPVTRIPTDVEVPTTGVLLRTYRGLLHGRVERLPGETGANDD